MSMDCIKKDAKAWDYSGMVLAAQSLESKAMHEELSAFMTVVFNRNSDAWFNRNTKYQDAMEDMASMVLQYLANRLRDRMP